MIIVYVAISLKLRNNSKRLFSDARKPIENHFSVFDGQIVRN